MWLDGNQGGAVVGDDPISRVAGFGYSINEAMAELEADGDIYYRNWEEFADAK